MSRIARIFFQSWLVIAIFLPVGAMATATFKPLKPEQAFNLSVEVTSPQSVSVNWQIAKNYFLYAKRLQITSDSPVPTQIDLPAPKKITGLDGKPEQAYLGKVQIPITFKTVDKLPEDVVFTLKYQGCAKEGFCYPPMKKVVVLNMATKMVSFESQPQAIKQGFSFSRLLMDQNQIKVIFSTEHFAVTLLVFLVLGMLLAFTPCVLPMLPILTGIIVGEKDLLSTSKAFLLSCTYVLGVAVTYACAGIIATLVGSSIQVWMQQPVFIILLSVLLVLLAFSLFEFFDLPVSRHWQNRVTRWSARHQGGTYIGVFFMGIFSTLIVSPCITAPMLGVLLYIGQTGNMMLGASALFVMGIGMGIPLIIVATSAGQWLPKSGSWMRVIVKLFGLVMFAMAIWVLSRLLSDTVTIFLWGAYFIAVAVFMLVFLPALIHRRLLARSAGLISGVLGVLLVLNALGEVGFLSKWTGQSTEQQVMTQQFIVIHNEDELKSEIAKASIKRLPVLLDFYADWCEACVSMDKKVFDLATTQSLLANFVLIRADLTNNTSADEALMKKYDVIAPPTILFFKSSGQEINSNRIVGEVDAKEFTDRLNTFKAENCSVKVQC